MERTDFFHAGPHLGKLRSFSMIFGLDMVKSRRGQCVLMNRADFLHAVM